jgi:hypothetical protein
MKKAKGRNDSKSAATRDELLARLEGYQDLITEVAVVISTVRAYRIDLRGSEDRLERALEKASPGMLAGLDRICRPKPRTELIEPALQKIAKKLAA